MRNSKSVLNRKVQAFIGAAAFMLAAVFIAGCKTEINNTSTAPETFAIIFNAGEHGGIDAKVGGKKINTGVKLVKDTVITFTATPESGYTVDKWDVTGGELVSGTGTGGSVGHVSRSNNQPHTVSLTSYRIGETEVTQELWQAVTGANPCWFQGNKNLPDGTEVQEKRPVEYVNWYESIAFCNELTKKIDEMGASECVYYSNEFYTAVYTEADAQAQTLPFMNISKKGFRLPTEAEWEWAAKGGTEKRWSETDVRKELKDYAWYKDNNDRKTHQVKLKKPNGYGLYDMNGNVWEWCWDWIGDSTPAGGQDPLGENTGKHRVQRGGSAESGSDYSDRVFRGSAPAKRNYRFNGLRLVCHP